MPGINISIYLKDEDHKTYRENMERLNQSAREGFEKELKKVKKEERGKIKWMIKH